MKTDEVKTLKGEKVSLKAARSLRPDQTETEPVKHTTLINCVIDHKDGTESGHISSLNPKTILKD